MSVQGWKYYNHAMIPDGNPDEVVDITAIESGEIWKNVNGEGTPLLARWTTNWDCGHETNWWYVLKDDPIDLSSLKSKRRYKINKGNKHFEVKVIDSRQYVDEICEIRICVLNTYPKKYRPNTEHNQNYKEVLSFSDHYTVFGAFNIETGKLCGYANIRESGRCAELVEVKTLPESEKNEINAAIVYRVLCHYEDLLKNGYILDGARNISHETGYQDYLKYYFGFRNAYCNLCVAYHPKIKGIVKIAYPFRRLLKKLDRIRLVHQLNGVLKMEEIVRER